jgi:hypothetical protein
LSNENQARIFLRTGIFIPAKAAFCVDHVDSRGNLTGDIFHSLQNVALLNGDDVPAKDIIALLQTVRLVCNNQTDARIDF